MVITTLTAVCYDCNAEVTVYGIYEGLDEDWREQWNLVDPFEDEDSHRTHDVSILEHL